MTEAAHSLVVRFIEAFSRGIRDEMDALRAELGTFEIPVRRSGHTEDRYTVIGSTEKLYPDVECTFRTDGGEFLVRVVSRTDAWVELEPRGTAGRSHDPAPMDRLPAAGTLVVYPWFLYERLLDAVSRVADDSTLHADFGLMAFGKLPSTDAPVTSAAVEAERQLNAEQREAVQYACRMSRTLIWGPPGTGKTHTIAALIDRLVASGERVLVTSTTNAAVDQTIRAAGKTEITARIMDDGQAIRFGGDSESEFLSVGEVTRRRTEFRRQVIQRIEREAHESRDHVARAQALTSLLGNSPSSDQLDLFEISEASALGITELASVFSADTAAALAAAKLQTQQEALTKEVERLSRRIEGAEQKAAEQRTALRTESARVVPEARIVFATLTQLSVRQTLTDQRFDAVIIDEAGMAILPAVFHAACLASRRIILVGDPRQLPPIVSAKSDIVRRAVGRCIFDVLGEEEAVMLRVQYRMHPAIGELVSEAFYEGKLRHHASTQRNASVAARDPYPGRALIVCRPGTDGCRRSVDGRSRENPKSASLAVELAAKSIRVGILDPAIITPYAAQSRLIGRILADSGLESASCATVHRFQGHERDVIIFDAVDTEPLPPGLLTSRLVEAANLINVSISRARGKLILIADVAYFRTRAPDAPITRVLETALRLSSE